MPLINTPLDTSLTTIYSSIGDSVVSVAYFCNIGTTQSFNVYLVPSTQVTPADETNLIYKAVQVTASDTYVMDKEKLVLGNGDQIVAMALSYPYMLASNGIIATVCYLGA